MKDVASGLQATASATSYTNIMHDARFANDYRPDDNGIPPSLPPIQRITNGQSFANMFDAPLATPEDGIFNDEMQPLLPCAISPGPEGTAGIIGAISAGSPVEPIGLVVEDLPPPVDSSDYMPVLSDSPLRYTSSGRSTVRSNDTCGSPRPSQPSSRSSIDESFDADRYRSTLAADPVGRDADTMAKFSRSESYWQKARISSTTGSETGPYHAPTEVSYKNKPLPPKPHDVVDELDSYTITKPRVALTYSSPQNILQSTRGARLGKQMTRGFNSAAQNLLENQRSLQQQRTNDATPANGTNDLLDLSIPVRRISHGKVHSASFHSVTPERVLLGILSQVATLKDLQSLSMVNQGFNRAFRRYEKDLVSRVLFKQSLPAWEFHQISKCEQKHGAFKLRSVQKDMSTIRALQSFILMNCGHCCRPSTIDALSGNEPRRKTDLDNALWRIWIFCKLFGRNQRRDQIFATQILWLNGGERLIKDERTVALGISNGAGLSPQQLEDMSEMWSCLEALLAGFRGREEEARSVGIFDLCTSDGGETKTTQKFLNEWIHDILALGPKAVLTLTTCSFVQAKVLGLTKWSPPSSGQSRVSFLKAAIEQVYRERLVTEARSKATQFDRLARSRSTPGRPYSDGRPVYQRSNTSQLTIATNDDRRSEPLPLQLVIKPLDCNVVRSTRDLTPKEGRSQTPTPLTPNTPIFSSFAITQGASARLGATLFPIKPTNMQSPSLIDYKPYRQDRSSARNSASVPSLMDPTDVALMHLIKVKGVPVTAARRALALSDDGKRVHLSRATEILASRFKLPPKAKNIGMSELPGSLPAQKLWQRPASSVGPAYNNFPPAISSPRERQRLNKPNRYRGASLGVILDEEEHEEDAGRIHPLHSARINLIDQRNTPQGPNRPVYWGPPRSHTQAEPQFEDRSSTPSGKSGRPGPQRATSDTSVLRAVPSSKFNININKRLSNMARSTSIGLGMSVSNTKGNHTGRVSTIKVWNLKEGDQTPIIEAIEQIGLAY